VRLDIKGIGWVTPSGIGSGQRGEAFVLGPGKLPALKSRLFLGKPHPRFGRFDLYAKAGFGAIALAMKSAGLDQWAQKRAIGLVAGTRRGCLAADLAYFKTAAFHGGAMASPNLFAYTLSSTMLGEASIQFGLTGPSFVIDDSEGNLAAIHAALDLMHWGFCETVAAGWCDVDSEIMSGGVQEPCGAVFVLLARDADAGSWQWNGGKLTFGAERIDDLAQLARIVLKDRHSNE
jgi:3-oxoacyl-[acyl-carrier-protein] synthase II